ncbi:hypothetical protein [Actinomadura sp. GTD37]|uniref:hypothetical protein n=1 Tax=Actinomadura sp. GTD37 TaxID=1778030 RepID=UPI0035C0A61D
MAMKRTATGLAAGSALLAGGLLAAPPANASPPAQIMKVDMFLADSAIWVAPASARLRPADREIDLAAGKYAWNHKWDEYNPPGVAQHTYEIRLAAGTYYWNCSVYTKTDYYLFDFFTRCSLRPKRTGAATAYSPEMRIAPHGVSTAWVDGAVMHGSHYDWSSTLTRLGD